MLKIYAMGLEFFRKKLEVRLSFYSVVIFGDTAVFPPKKPVCMTLES